MSNLETPNQFAIEITKLLISGKLSKSNLDTKTSVALFINIYNKVLSEIEYFEQNPDEISKVIDNEFQNN